MSNEIKVTQSLSCSNVNLTYQSGNISFRANQAGSLKTGNTQSIGTTATQVAFASSFSNPGWGEFTNLDSTNYLQIGVEVSSTFYPLVTLLPGETTLFRLAQLSNVYAQANTAACLLDYTILET